MEKMLKYILVLSFMMLIVACEKKAEEPEILLFEAVPSTIVAGESVTFRMRFEGDYVTLWTGDEGRNYDAYIDSISKSRPDAEEAGNRFYDKGIALAMTDTVYTYVLYTDPGSYNARLIVSNTGKLGDEIKRTEATAQVEVLEAP
jgi:hypothetical protein